MAKYEITYRCGHEGTVELVGKEVDRQRKLHWLRTSCDCVRCQRAKEEADKSNDNYIRVTVLYKDYKNKYENCSTVSSSYNKDTKSIDILVPKVLKVGPDDNENRMMFGDVIDLVPEKVIGLTPDTRLSYMSKVFISGPVRV